MNSATLKKLVSPDDFFDKNYIIIPINEANHWKLIILCNIRKIVTGEARMLLFNSIQSPTGYFPRNLRKFVFLFKIFFSFMILKIK